MCFTLNYFFSFLYYSYTNFLLSSLFKLIINSSFLFPYLLNVNNLIISVIKISFFLQIISINITIIQIKSFPRKLKISVLHFPFVHNFKKKLKTFLSCETYIKKNDFFSNDNLIVINYSTKIIR